MKIVTSLKILIRNIILQFKLEQISVSSLIFNWNLMVKNIRTLFGEFSNDELEIVLGSHKYY
jgi:hypothetical protein